MPQRQTFLCSKGKGNSRGLPSPPSSGPFPLPPPAAVTLRGPLPGSAAARGWGGCRRLATCTFETKQIRPPRANPGPGQGRLFSRCRILGSCVPQKGPERASSWGWDTPHRPPPAPRSELTNTPEVTHPQSHAPGRRPLPRLAQKKKLSKLSARPPPPSSPLRRPALTFLSGFPVHAALDWVRGVLAGGRGR